MIGIEWKCEYLNYCYRENTYTYLLKIISLIRRCVHYLHLQQSTTIIDHCVVGVNKQRGQYYYKIKQQLLTVLCFLLFIAIITRMFSFDFWCGFALLAVSIFDHQRSLFLVVFLPNAAANGPWIQELITIANQLNIKLEDVTRVNKDI